jgi:hypothetical protein
MKTIRNLLLLVLLLPSLAAAQEKTGLAVLQFEPRNISQAEAVILSDRLRAELVNSRYFNVLEREQMDKILREQKFQLTGACNDATCLVKVGQLMAVSKMMGGTISKIGNTYTVQARVIDVEKGIIDQEVSQDVVGTIEDLQQWGMKKVVWKLVPSASLFVSSIPADADVYWDQRKVGKTDFKIENEGLGTHRLTIKKLGYEDYEGTVDLKEVKDYDIKVRLNIREYSVRVDGTPKGAQVVMNDTVKLGTIPCMTKLPFGTYNFKIKAKGYNNNAGLLVIDRDQNYSLNINLKRKSRVSAGFRSLFLPGSGQRYSNRQVMGTIYVLAWTGAMANMGFSIGNRMGSLKDSERAEEDYLQADNAVNSPDLFDEWQLKYDDFTIKDKRMKQAIYMAAAVWGINFLDAIVFFPGKPKVKVEPVKEQTGEVKTSASLTYCW